MPERKRLAFLILLMTSVSLIVGGIAIAALYIVAFEQQKEHLVVTAQSLARLIDAVARFDAVYSTEYPDGPQAATLSQIVDAHERYRGFGETGELILARRVDDRIVFLIGHRDSNLSQAQPLPFDGELAEPMRRALSGQSGTVIGNDYRGHTVLAAHEPVRELNVGIVAKIDLAEIRAPFLRSALLGLAVALVVVFIGAMLFVRISNPMIKGIQDRESRLRAILDTVVDAIVTIDEQGTVESVNRAAESTFGYTAEELIGQNVGLLMPSPFREEHTSYLSNYVHTGEKKIIGIGREVLGARKNGTTFPMDLSVSEVQVGGRRLFTGIARDITERRQSEQAARLALIGQMMAGLAHESRNALQRAQACLEMLALDISKESDSQNLLERTQRALDDMHRLFEEVRGYAAPIHLDVQTCDLSQLWSKSWSDLELMRREKNVELLAENDGVDLHCKVDSHRIEQVLRNILENAVAACPEAGEITVRCADSDIDGAPALRISIADNGPGLTAEQIHNIFEPFFTTKKKGTGLGMAIAARIVEAHGGRIEVGDYAPGAEILVSLPRNQLWAKN